MCCRIGGSFRVITLVAVNRIVLGINMAANAVYLFSLLTSCAEIEPAIVDIDAAITVWHQPLNERLVMKYHHPLNQRL